jgi:hypothetical protein
MTTAEASLKFDDEVISLNDFYAIKHEDKLVIYLDGDLNYHSVVKLNDLPDEFDGNLAIATDRYVSVFDSNNDAFHSCNWLPVTGVNCPNSFINILSNNEEKIEAEFNLNLFSSGFVPPDSLPIIEGYFNLPIEENSVENKFSVLKNGNDLQMDILEFTTNYSNDNLSAKGISIRGMNTNINEFFTFHLPFDITTGEYNFEDSGIINVGYQESPRGTIVISNVISDYVGTLNITNHFLKEREIKGNASFESGGNNYQIEFEGFYF